MATKGSTAPAITSPLLAWPAKPTPRSTPLVTPVTGTFESFELPSRDMTRGPFTGSPTGGKGKGRANDDEDYQYKEVERNYRPPQKPLSPRQLGRIAQSFGIEVPSLPTPPLSNSSPGPRSSSAASSSRQPTRPSPFLLTVIPPTSLQPLSASTSRSGAESARRWRRGRLIPLQPTMGSMLLAIAREYGLPSTKGINLYIANTQRSSSTSSVSDISDEPGPRISQATWTSLFATQAANLPVSRTSTPDGSPRRTGQLFNKDPHPSSPLSPWSEMLPHPRPLFGSSSNRSTPIKSGFVDQSTPLTPSSINLQAISPSPVIATIEFDIDPDEATWYHDFNTSGRRRKLSTASEGGVRELRLVQKYSDSRPRFLRDMEANTLSDQSCSTMDGSSMIKTADESHGSEDFTEASSSPDRGDDDLLAPFELRKGLRDEIDKRGSALVMKEQLDDLEIMMRQLSPKEIRLTSPRELTPRMAAKVATLQFPPALPPRPINPKNPPPLPPRSNNRPAKSPLVNSFTDPDDNSASGQMPMPPRSAWPAVPYAKHSESPGSPQLEEYFRPPARPSLDAHGPRKSSFSEETRKRMEAEQEAAQPLATEWRPRRPARPPSPNISSQVHARTPSYSLSPELVSTLKSPPVGAPKSPETEDRKPKGRSNSISLKGLRAQMSKAGNRASKKDEIEPMPTTGTTDRFGSDKPEERETYGLFKQSIDSTSSFPGLDGRPSMSSALSPSISEFGSVDLHSPLPDGDNVQSTASLPAKQQSGMRRLFGGSLPFKNRSSSDNHTHTLAQSSQRASLKSRRNPSHDGANLTISPPIPESFHKIDNGFSHPIPRKSSQGEIGGIPMTSPRRQPHPGSPSSPRNVKRKPVPGAGDVELMMDNQGGGQGIGPVEAAAGLTGSVSFGSVASFVLDEAPKRRTRGQGEYR